MNRLVYALFVLLGLGLPNPVFAQPSPDSLATYLRTHAPIDTGYVRVMDKVILYRTYQKADYAHAGTVTCAELLARTA